MRYFDEPHHSEEQVGPSDDVNHPCLVTSDNGHGFLFDRRHAYLSTCGAVLPRRCRWCAAVMMFETFGSYVCTGECDVGDTYHDYDFDEFVEECQEGDSYFDYECTVEHDGQTFLVQLLFDPLYEEDSDDSFDE